MSNPLEAFATFNQPSIQLYNFTALGTTPVACQFNVPNNATTVRLRITNLHATNTVAFTLGSQSSATVPQVQVAITSQTGSTATFVNNTMVSTAGAALTGSGTPAANGDGIRVAANSSLEINITGSTKVWLVASAASTPVQVVGILQNG